MSLIVRQFSILVLLICLNVHANSQGVWFSGVIPVGVAKENHIDTFWKPLDDSLRSRLQSQENFQLLIGSRKECLADSQVNRNPEVCQVEQAKKRGANWVITARVQEQKGGQLQADLYLRLVLADEWLDSGVGRGSRKDVASALAGISAKFARILNAQAPMTLDTFSFDFEDSDMDTISMKTESRAENLKGNTTSKQSANSKNAKVFDEKKVDKMPITSKSESKRSKTIANSWVTIGSGCFFMGSPDSIGSEDEHPQHEVCVSEFQIQKYPVSQSEYTQIFRDRPWENCQGVTCTPADPRHPAWYVNWSEANSYCSKIGARLPTEAEYEFVARAGSNTVYAWGDSTWQACEYANIADYSLRQEFPKWVTFPCHDGHARVSPVGSRRANPWGVHDMNGNVWEWTGDWYSPSYYQISPKQDPKGPAVGTGKVMRGGSWLSGPSGARVAYRDGFPPEKRYSGATGFRCVKTSQ